MAKRGRPSAASLAIVPQGPLEITSRPRPPAELTEEQTEVWIDIVNSHPADHFNAVNVLLLAQLCKHVTGARLVGKLIERATSKRGVKVDEMRNLFLMQKVESAIIAVLATKLRLTNQSIINQRGNRVRSSPARPWSE